MTPEEVQKINDLYKQIDALTAENNSLKEQLNSVTSDDVGVHLETLAVRSKSIEDKLDKHIKGCK